MFAWKHHGLLQVAESMVGGAMGSTENVDAAMNLTLWSSHQPTKEAALAHRPGVVRLDRDFVLIEGRPYSFQWVACKNRPARRI